MRLQTYFPDTGTSPFFCMPLAAGWYRNEPDHSEHRAPHAVLGSHLHIVLSGKGTLVNHGVTYPLKAGDAFLWASHLEQRYSSDRVDPWEVLWVHFHGERVMELLAETGFLNPIVWHLRSREGLEAAMKALIEEGQKLGPSDDVRLSCLFYEILTLFMAQAIPYEQDPEQGALQRVTQLLPAMREAAAEPFVLEEWAARAGISPSYFCRVFRRITGMRPNDHIRRHRLQRAKKMLLEQPACPVSRIAKEVGYPADS